jgi:hypothetical protein
VTRRPSGYLLPPYDEYLVGYQDRSAVSDASNFRKVGAASWSLDPAVVVKGQVVGTWRRVLARDGVAVSIKLFRPLGSRERQLVVEATNRYGRFLRVEPRLTFQR